MSISKSPWPRPRVVVFGFVVCLLQAGTLRAQTAPPGRRIFKGAGGKSSFEGTLTNDERKTGTAAATKFDDRELTIDLTLLGRKNQAYVHTQEPALKLRDTTRASHKHAAFEECPVDFDFEFRDTLPQTKTPVENWNTNWGPSARTYSRFEVPDCVKDPVDYQRQRVLAVARKYLGLPYRHKHIPAAGGLDCSNFASWVYNYGFGIRFSSNVGKQAETAGRRLNPDEDFEPGDLLFQTDRRGESIAHAVIYIGEDKIIDSTKGKVAIRNFRGWYKDRYSHARRIIE